MPMAISFVTDTREAWPLVVKLEAARITAGLDILAELHAALCAASTRPGQRLGRISLRLGGRLTSKESRTEQQRGEGIDRETRNFVPHGLAQAWAISTKRSQASAIYLSRRLA